MYTPEKSRRSLPLLLEGNLPYRRARRQSGQTLVLLSSETSGRVHKLRGCFVLQLRPKTSRRRSTAMVRRFTPPSAASASPATLTFLLACPHVSARPRVLLEVLQL